MQLRDDWIDWINPKFLDDPGWEEWLSKQKQWGGTPPNLREAIHVLDGLEIFRQNHEFAFLLEKKIHFRGETPA